MDDHGYEFREYPESDFDRRANECSIRRVEIRYPVAEISETSGLLRPEVHEIIHQIEIQEMTLCYKMLLLTEMAELADSDGRVAVSTLAEHFRAFFARRVLEGKVEENPKRVKSGLLAGRSISEWERVIRDQPVRYLTESFVVDEINSIRWAARIWSKWSEELREQIRSAAWDRLD